MQRSNEAMIRSPVCIRVLALCVAGREGLVLVLQAGARGSAFLCDHTGLLQRFVECTWHRQLYGVADAGKPGLVAVMMRARLCCQCIGSARI